MIRGYGEHTFHIPVMGLGFTIDTPAKVAHLGISSAISLVDDILMEKLREFYSIKLDLPFHEISDKVEDFKAKRITSYLNMIDKIVKEKIESLKNSIHEKGSEFEKYLEMLPDFSAIKQKFSNIHLSGGLKTEVLNWIHHNLPVGSIDVNIMTKLDSESYRDDEKLPSEYNNAHAALRGFANSNLRSSIVLSAGMNPRLYTYLENFDAFYPDNNGELEKKIILKVSDFRSAMIQGKFLAKKGLWVSEYRIESGLNCGGHAFATEGYLMGPIMEQFKNERDDLIRTTYELYADALRGKNRFCPDVPLPVWFTAQGGVGTKEEHDFLLDHYNLDSVGWGTPFLLVPEVTNVDKETLELLCNATEDDLYLSSTSPVGPPFNTVRGNSMDMETQRRASEGRPGSACKKKYVTINKEYGDKAICVASRQYQSKKIKELKSLDLSPEEYQRQYESVIEKMCICVGLENSTLLANGLDAKMEGPGVSVCPGPNIAWFNKPVSLKTMVDHIYGRKNIINEKKRPNLFVKELTMYLDHLKNLIQASPLPVDGKSSKHLLNFKSNLKDGINYYKDLFKIFKDNSGDSLSNILSNLEEELERITFMLESEVIS